MKALLLSSLLVVVAGAACAEDAGTSNPTQSPDGPMFLSFGANFTQWSIEAEPRDLEVSAVLTDPQGVEDLVGGTLKTSSGATLKTFATSAQEGAYNARVTWEEASATMSMPALNASGTLEVTAEFYDQAGNQAIKSLELEVTCADAEEHDVWALRDDGCVYVDCYDGRLCAGRDDFDATEVCMAAFGTRCLYVTDDSRSDQLPCTENYRGALVHCE